MDHCIGLNHGATSKNRRSTCWTWLGRWCWVVFLVGFPLISVVLTGTILVGACPTPFVTVGLTADLLFMISYLVTLVGIVVVVLYGENTKSHHHEKHSTISITCIFLLGVGDSLLNWARSGDHIIWIINRNYPPNSNCRFYIIMAMLEGILTCIYQLCILMFIMYELRYPSQSKSPLAKTIKACLSISCLLQWFLLILEEIYDEHKTQNRCILNNTVDFRSFQEIEPFLYPLGSEFRFACFIELLIMSDCWDDVKQAFRKIFSCLTQVTVGCQCTAFQPMAMVGRCFEAVFPTIYRFPAGDHELVRHRENKCLPRKCRRLLSLIFIPAFGLLLITVSIAFVLFQEVNIPHQRNATIIPQDNKTNMITLVSEVCEIALAIIISIVSCYTLIVLCRAGTSHRTAHSLQELFEQTGNPMEETDIRIKTVEKLNRKFKIDFFFLLVAFCFLNTYSVLTAIGSASYHAPNEITAYIKWLTIIVSIIPMIQTSIQVIAVRKIPEHDQDFDANINMWIILSFAIWLFDSFSAKGYDTNKIQLEFYRQHWETISRIIVPMGIFFRFHSCMIFANFKANAYWDEHTVSLT